MISGDRQKYAAHIIKPTQTAINRKKYTFCITKLSEPPKMLKPVASLIWAWFCKFQNFLYLSHETVPLKCYFTQESVLAASARPASSSVWTAHASPLPWPATVSATAATTRMNPSAVCHRRQQQQPRQQRPQRRPKAER